MSRYKELYNTEIVEAMTKKFGYKNVMEVPKLNKIVINMAVGEAKENAKKKAYEKIQEKNRRIKERENRDKYKK